MDEILGEFIAETLETLEVLSGEVVAWEADPSDGSRLDAFFRFFHTVKGSCGFLNLPQFERLAHAAEEVLATIRRGERSADQATVSAVLAVMDRIGAMARAVADGQDEAHGETENDELIEALVATASGPEPAAADSEADVEAEEDMDARSADHARLIEEPCEASDDELAVSAPVPRNGGRERVPRTIRLPLALIDQLMNGISDMVLARNDLARKMRDRDVDPDLESSFERLSTNVADLRDMISKTRMQRVDRLYAAIPRLVRDLSHELGKKVSLELDGGDVEMDREMIEMVLDPLTHIVRNALDHGIDTPARRVEAGKPETGKLRVVARQSGNQIVIKVSDDGRGIDRVALVEKALAAGLLSTADAAVLSDEQMLQLVFHPGLSTAAQVTSVSGRGVGMDVVRANIEQIGGVVGIESVPGEGTSFSMRVPLTLTIIPGLIVRSAGHYFAMPRGNVIELLHQNSSMVTIEDVGGARIATIRGEPHSLIDLEDVLGIPRSEDWHGPRTLMVVRSSVGQPFVLGVEVVESNEELVIRPASPLVTAAGIFAGMTLPDNGQPMLLLDAAGIAHSARLPLGDARRDLLEPAKDKKADEQAELVQALLFAECDGNRRLIPLSIIDRVEDIEPDQIAQSDGRTFARIDGRLFPAIQAGDEISAPLKALRLHAGGETLCFLISDVLDIIEIPAKLDVQLNAGRIAGLVMVEDRQIEVIDPFALFREVALGGTQAARPPRPIHCQIADENDTWLRGILAPLLRQAGHDVTIGSTASGKPDIILCTGGAGAESAGDVPVLTLSDKPEEARDGTVYRYDRDRIFDAIARLSGNSAENSAGRDAA